MDGKKSSAPQANPVNQSTQDEDIKQAKKIASFDRIYIMVYTKNMEEDICKQLVCLSMAEARR
jgi:hypothetical protein